MFGCVVAGRLVQTNLQQVDATKYIFQLEDAHSINHLVVFMTEPFPAGFGATVHFHWPTSMNQWQYLGILTNDKPSAIFRLGGKRSNTTPSTSMSGLNECLMETSASERVTAQLGISIEPLDQVLAQASHSVQAANTTGSEMVLGSRPDPSLIMQKLLENLYNYCSGCATGLPPNATALFGINMDTTFIPLKALNDWFSQTMRKLKQDPQGNFLNKT